MVSQLDWQWRSFGQLSTAEIYTLLRARAEVFVVEQHCAFLDLDGIDADAQHLLCWASAPAQSPAFAAYLRLIGPGRKYAEPSIGRVLTTASFRGRGYGRALMRHGLQRASVAFPGSPLRIGAQQRLEHFYASLGFRAASPTYVEDGIDHVEMLIAAADMR
jgi:ElaA protein